MMQEFVFSPEELKVLLYQGRKIKGHEYEKQFRMDGVITIEEST